MNQALSIVIPVYNSEQSLDPLFDRLSRVLDGLGMDYEMILVDDGSMDSSWAVVRRLAAASPRVRGIRLLRNFGQHNALLCGIRNAKHPVIVTMDDDLQNPPEEIPRLLERMREGSDVVYGTPQKEQHGFLRDAASRITKMVLQKSMGAETASSISAFRAFRTKLRESFADYKGSFVSIDVLLTWGTRRFSAIPVKHEKRAMGQSNYTVFKLFLHAMNMVTGFSVLPLQIATGIGLLVTLFGVAVLVFVVGRYVMEGSPVQGFPFLASMLAIFSGAQLFALGIMGEYLARIHIRTMDRPAYAVGMRTEADGE
jgi:glycosyltransferase involved in cell wall biosynthesis